MPGITDLQGFDGDGSGVHNLALRLEVLGCVDCDKTLVRWAMPWVRKEREAGRSEGVRSRAVVTLLEGLPLLLGSRGTSVVELRRQDWLGTHGHKRLMCVCMSVMCRLSKCSTPAMSSGQQGKEEEKQLPSLAPPLLCEGIELEALKVRNFDLSTHSGLRTFQKEGARECVNP